ncbi:hypothetical protein GCM10011376_21420 [Nocardioides flavus (ex Wang et al. 2016)]|uniref:DUF4870 domain-containing protein n=1 Tax=Nocardioides flavus (ex Wang et al. 2016) TaxID=2058780 RepID=A0ABQ3HIP0_9ACTN|nr:DUF4870 domain-containing protein [Nocardioides flavus (ex Wang et al. 2016)]GHE17532.1 hypothetical protein GCM10011376_21420 [Nocardioides flavus (ex Wang et al. 2016)]
MSDQYPTDPHDPTRAYAQQSYGQQSYGQQPTTGYPSSAPSAISPQEERTWGAVSHAGAVAAMVFSAGFLGFLASIVVYVMYKDRGPFVRSHAANSLNVQISMFIWLVVVTVLYVVLGVVTIGIGFVVLWPVFFVPPVIAGILHVVGAVKAWNGEWWNPPLTPRFVS